jgi:lysozyme family protein
MNNFELALAHVLKAEGGYVSHALDRGRETSMGITRATLEHFRGTVVTPEDVKALTRDEAKEIYLKLYWIPNGLDRIKHPVIAIALFDQIVNRRATEVVRGVQAMVSNELAVDLEADGILGPVTADALNRIRPERLLIGIAIEAQQSYLAIVERAPAQAVFLKGWLARTWRLLSMV